MPSEPGRQRIALMEAKIPFEGHIRGRKFEASLSVSVNGLDEGLRREDLKELLTRVAIQLFEGEANAFPGDGRAQGHAAIRPSRTGRQSIPGRRPEDAKPIQEAWINPPALTLIDGNYSLMMWDRSAKDPDDPSRE